MSSEYAIELKNITKRFGSVVANDKVNLGVKSHEILAILGENGSGKTTLMNMIAGIYRPDEGEILINGNPVTIRSPKDAYNYKIGMIHQHYQLVNVLTAAENIILGQEGSFIVNKKQVNNELTELCDRYGFKINLDQKIYDMSVSQKQTVEILKTLYKGADILILDEPTAVLTPQETKSLFQILQNMREKGKSIIIITHKLNEVLEISDRVSVLRKGKYIGSVITKNATVNSLTEMMVGEKISLDIKRSEPVNPKDVLSVNNITVLNKEGLKSLNGVSFTARSGEILGVAGIAGSGMKELLESIVGMQHVESGNITYMMNDVEFDITNKNPAKLVKMGVNISFVPEDRLGMGLVGSMGMTNNFMLKRYHDGHAPLLSRREPKSIAQKIKEGLDVVTPSIDYPVRRLSGGNVQKVLVGREISSHPKVLLVAYPVRGLDINSSYLIYNLLNGQKEKGVAVICVIEDLDVMLSLCDRVVVLNGGRISGCVDARSTTKEELGILMTSDIDSQKNNSSEDKNV